MLVLLSGTDGLIHGNYCWLSASVICDVIGRDFEVLGRYKEEDVIMLALYFNVGFIARAYWVDRAFMLHIEGMAVESGRGGVIEDGLIRDLDVKDRAENEGGFSGSDCKRDVKGEYKAKDVGSIVDFSKIDFGIIRLGMVKFVGLVMIFPVLIAELKLRAAFLLKGTFSGIKLIKCLSTMKAIIIRTFIDSDIFAHFPFKQGAIAIRAEELGCGVFAESLVYLKEMATDFAFQLSAFVAVIVIDIDMRGIAQRADRQRWDFGRVGPLLNRAKRFAAISLVLSQKELVVFSRLNGLLN